MSNPAAAAPFLSLLRDLLDWCESESLPVLVIGGVAVALIAKPRLTRDVDAVVRADLDRVESLVRSGRRFGFVPRHDDAVAFARQNRVLLLRHEPSGDALDVSFAGLPFEEESFTRMVRMDVAGLSLPLPTPEDLVIMKAVARRQQDLADIATILEVHPALDWRRVRRWVREFARVLEMPEVLSDLERIYREVRKRA